MLEEIDEALRKKNWLKIRWGEFRKILNLCVAGILLLSSEKVCAQKLIFENIGVRSGLPSTEVYNLFQDAKGYLWIFTEYGIVKFNGTNYVPVCKNLSLKESAIYAVTASGNGNMFISNSIGNIYRIHDDKAYKVLGTDPSFILEMKKHGMVIADLFLDNSNGLYISSIGKTYYYPATKYWVKGLKKEKVKKASDKNLFAVRINNHKKSGDYNHFTVKIIDHNGKPKFGWLKRETINTRLIARSRNGNDYIAMAEQLEYHNQKGKTKILKYNSTLLNIEVDKYGHVWVACLGGGLIEYDEQLNVIGHYFDKIIVSDILFDTQGGMWVSTIGRGVYHCKDINLKSYNNIPELKDSYIYSLREENNSLFIGTHSGSLVRLTRKGIQQIDVGALGYALTDILHFENKYMISSGRSLVCTDENFKIQRYINGATYGLLRSDDETIFIVIANAIGRYTLSTGKFDNHMIGLPRSRYAACRFGNEFFVTSPSTKILRVKNWKFSFPSYLNSLEDKGITRTVSEDGHNIWFCSKGYGIYCLDPKNKLHNFSNLPSKIVNDICFTKDNQVVLATNKGVFATSRDSINSKSAWKLILNEESSRLTEYEGRLFIGTKHGLTSMNSNALIIKKKYRFHLNSIVSKGKELKPHKDMVFNYNQNDLYLNYDLLNYHSDDHKLEYKLEGPTQLHDVVSGTSLHLQNLTPGEYVLYVNPLMNNTMTSDLMVVTKFTVRPAFWQTWTFRIVVLIIILSIIFLIFWWINNRRNKKIQEVNQIENLLTEYRLTALKSQVNPHFMSNSLVAIQRLILEEENDKANQYIAKFSLLLRSLLEYSNRSSATIRNELRMIELYVELEQLRFSHQFLFEIRIDPLINVENTYMPALITQPFVENAIWHGLLPLEEKRQPVLILSVTECHNGIVISVKDNGVGRTFNKERKKHGEFESRGTSLIIQRMENLNRLYNSKDAGIYFVDLKDENGEPAGTEVNIVLPDEILTQLYERRNS